MGEKNHCERYLGVKEKENLHFLPPVTSTSQLQLLRSICMGPQALSPNMKSKSRLLSLKKPLECGICSLKSILMFCNKFSWLVLRVGYSFLLHPTFNTSLEPHLQKVLSCRHMCCTWDLGLRTWDPMWGENSQLPCPWKLRLYGSTSSKLELRAWDPLWTCSWNTNFPIHYC
jgi:hypothetical protein